jgi:hypothetical protein
MQGREHAASEKDRPGDGGQRGGKAGITAGIGRISDACRMAAF